MNRKEAKYLWPIVKAFSEGCIIQQSNGESWIDCGDYIDLLIPRSYRVKPAFILEPFHNRKKLIEEINKHHPIGWVKSKEDGNTLKYISQVLPEAGVQFTDKTICSSSELFSKYVFYDLSAIGEVKKVESTQ